MSNNTFRKVVTALQPSCTVLTDKHEFGSNSGKVYRVKELEDAISECLCEFFGSGGTCIDISRAWNGFDCDFTWSQAITIMVCCDMVNLDHISRHTIITTWMRLLATQGKCLNKALVKYYVAA